MNLINHRPDQLLQNIFDLIDIIKSEPLIVIEPLTKNPLPLSETLTSTRLCQTSTSTTPNSPVRSAPHSPIRSLLHTPARSSSLARPSTPVHLTTSPKKSTFSHPTLPVIISSPELTSALSNLKQKYLPLRLSESMYTEKQQNIQLQKSFEESEAENDSLRKEIAQLRSRISDLEAENKQAKEEIEALVIINKGLGKESDLQSKTAGSMISKSEKSESEGEIFDDNNGKSSSEIQPSQLSTKRSFLIQKLLG
ncbi:hypothetical protein F8M41_010141 [Gigaspora margarita]|uniref:Uncharacterized protein n=1 Tax=Gigaspora margarita TaxID=4874 RepID=A0A8H3X3Z7_GIGMA|nr:hypothetical protein F8M41_010141 [Gigaspora margarita]